MPKRIIAFSGPVSSGKSSLSKTLGERYGFVEFRTRDVLRTLNSDTDDRQMLQKRGDELDILTNGEWVRDALVRTAAEHAEQATILVDSVRIKNQVDALRKAFGPARVVHVHVTAPLEVLAERYSKRQPPPTISYDEVRANATESRVDELREVADIVVDSHRSTPEDVFARVAGLLGLYGRTVERVVDVVVGGQYGSEGKGQVAAYLAPEYDVLVRVGGPNAGHKVYEKPKPYPFHLLPSGTRRCAEAQIVLGPGAVLRVAQLMKEIAECEVDAKRLAIDPQCMIIEDRDIELEEVLERTIGGTKQGVGSATSRKILRTAASPEVRLARQIPELKPYIKETRLVLEDAYSKRLRIL